MKRYILLMSSVIIGTLVGLIFSQLMYADQIVPAQSALALSNNLPQNIL